VAMIYREGDLYLFFETDISPTVRLRDDEGVYHDSDRSKVDFTLVKLKDCSTVEWVNEMNTDQLNAKAYKQLDVTPKLAQHNRAYLPGIDQTGFYGDYLFLSGDIDNMALGILANDKGELIANYQLIPGDEEAFKRYRPNAYFEVGDYALFQNGKIYWILSEFNPNISAGPNARISEFPYPRMVRIDIKSGKMEEMQSYGRNFSKREQYYLDLNYPILFDGKPNTVTFFGHDHLGKKVWFCRVNLDK
jgi:hypothetical protein